MGDPNLYLAAIEAYVNPSDEALPEGQDLEPLREALAAALPFFPGRRQTRVAREIADRWSRAAIDLAARCGLADDLPSLDAMLLAAALSGLTDALDAIEASHRARRAKGRGVDDRRVQALRSVVEALAPVESRRARPGTARAGDLLSRLAV